MRAGGRETSTSGQGMPLGSQIIPVLRCPGPTGLCNLTFPLFDRATGSGPHSPHHLRSLDPISVSSSHLLTNAPVQIVKLLPTSLPPSHTCLPPICTVLAPKPYCCGPTHGILRPAFSGHAYTCYRCLLEHPFIDSLMIKLYTFMAQLKA